MPMPGIHPKEQEQASQQVPQALDTATLRGPDVGGIIQLQDMYVAYDGRPIQPTYPDDEEKDPMRTQCPTGGCSSDKNLYKDIYNDLFQQQVVKTPTVNLQDKAQRREIHMRVVDILRPQVRENRNSIKQDKEGPPVAEGPKFIMKDGGIYYPRFRKSLQQMYTDQQRLRPQEYDPREHATMTLMEKTLVNGAKKVSHVSHNKDKQGNEAIRDQITMIWDEEVQRGRMIIENIALDGRFLTVEEAREVMQERLSGEAEVHPVDGVFIFTDKPRVIPGENFYQLVPHERAPDAVSVESVRDQTDIDEFTKKRFVNVIDDSVHADVALSSRDPDVRWGEAIPFDRVVPLGDMPAGEQAPRKDNTVVPPFLRRLLNILSGQQEEEQKKISPQGMLKKFFTNEHEASALDFQHVKELLHHADTRIREAGKKFVSRVAVRWQEMTAVKSLFSFAAEGGVGIGVALLGLRLMTRELPKMPKKQQLERKFQKGHAPKKTESLQKIPKRKRIRELFRSTTRVDKITLKRYFVKKEKRGVTVLLPVADALKRRFLKKHEARVALKEKNVRAAKPVERLWKTLHLWTRRLERLKNRSLRAVSHEKKVTGQKQKKEGMSVQGVIEVRRQETVLHFSFAWTLWSLFTLSHTDGVQGAISTIELNTDRKASGQETITETEAPQWILLGIIWYLSMIRESGFGNNNSTGQYVSPANPVHQYLIPQGVIFAYAS